MIPSPLPGTARTRDHCIALIAHDSKKDDMIAFAERYRAALTCCRIMATGTTGRRIAERWPDFQIRFVNSGPLGGDQQIGAAIAERSVDAVVFFVDALTPMPHDADVKALMRLAILYDIPMALNPATANLVMGLRETGASYLAPLSLASAREV